MYPAYGVVLVAAHSTGNECTAHSFGHRWDIDVSSALRFLLNRHTHTSYRLRQKDWNILPQYLRDRTVGRQLVPRGI